MTSQTLKKITTGKTVKEFNFDKGKNSFCQNELLTIHQRPTKNIDNNGIGRNVKKIGKKKKTDHV